jgi:glycosyltransferase involved in cell wall biosynthesis
MQVPFDVIITTLNRPTKVVQLIDQLLALVYSGKVGGDIIVVDSSEQIFQYNNKPEQLRIIKSSRKNQPYQRFLGLRAATADYVLFLDDDMEIIDDSFSEAFTKAVTDFRVVGLNLKFKNDNDFLGRLEVSVVPKNKFFIFLRMLSGYVTVRSNEFGLTGIRGSRVDNARIEFFSGGAFFAKRDLLYQGLSTTLFDVYDMRAGKGEDGITGFALSQMGLVYAHETVFFNHNDQGNSQYTINHYHFSKRVACSRLFLSFEYSKLKDRSLVIAFLHYQWFVFFRVLGLILNTLLKPGKSKFNQITGYIAGILIANFKLAPRYFLKRENDNRDFWNRLGASDLQASR